MSFLRNLWVDLVDKRLWPIALVLVGALVAVPLVLGGSASGGSDVAAAPATAGAAAVSTQVRVSEETGPSTIAPTGSRHNPFKQPKAEEQEQPAVESTPTPETTGGDTGATTGGGAAPETTTPSDTPTTTPSEPEKKPENTKVLRVDLRFGEPGETKQKLHDDIARLSALPSANEPIVIYLGVKKDRKTAAFLISSDATATGDGTCKPSPTNCQTIEMQQGDSTFLDIDLGSGVRQFRLDVKSIAEEDRETEDKASVARARMSRAGQDFLRSSIESGEVSLGGMDYSEKAGTLTSTPRATTAGPVGRGAYRADVRVGGVTRTDVRRLQLLPQRSTAEVLFLGVRDGGRAATFLNLSDESVAGAACKPSRTECRRFTVRTGATAWVGTTPVTVTSLSLRRLATVAEAERVRTRVAEAGEERVAEDELDLGDLALDPRTGTLTASPL